MNEDAKKLERVFDLKIDFGIHKQFAPIVQDTIDLIENDVLQVYRPNDESAFDSIIKDGEEVMASHADYPISIREWLPCACQRIVFSPYEQGKHLAAYCHNATVSLVPSDRTRFPPGPVGFSGEIRFTQAVLDLIQEIASTDNDRAVDAFRCIVAHELVHVFHIMMILIPAFIDWDSFWEGPMGSGHNRDDAMRIYEAHAMTLDRYGSDDERDWIAAYWPTYADKWFDALRR